MKQITVKVIDPVGLHARPATLAVGLASKCACNVTIEFNGNAKTMKSIMGVMSLGIPTQAEVVITCDGADEEAAIVAIEEGLRKENVIA